MASSWFGRERPQALYDLAGDVFPAKGVAANWAHWLGLATSGLLRLTILAVVYLTAFCFTTRTRTVASTAVLVCAYTAHTLTR